ncbi:uncharacterized protein LOC127731159 [Mytilus californianus]|uniref:uncharacterized protein LOC127731159 n=1 Tax=Mytilus californianus TaxID=6549 RepID=UPI0022475161|nr:uncharacterized protein LOC127731159 [Mytilus californianus]
MSSKPYRKLGTDYSPKSCGSCCKNIPLCCKITMVVLTVVVLAGLGLFVGFAATNPLHASCRVNWIFPSMTCNNVKTKLRNQISLWNGPDNCKNGGEKCLYKLVSESTNTLKATHETPSKHYKDDLTFTFSDAGMNCKTEGYSTSETWYAVLDSGTNYCNLHNLITGSGLSNTTGYTESTSNSQCTQYSSADCMKY